MEIISTQVSLWEIWLTTISTITDIEGSFYSVFFLSQLDICMKPMKLNILEYDI